MKKLGCLFMVLAAAGMAYAGKVDIFVTGLNGIPIEPTQKILVTTNELIELQIFYFGEPNMYLFGMSLDVTADGDGLVELSCNTPNWPVNIWDPSLTSIIPFYNGKFGVSSGANYMGLQGKGLGTPAVAIGNILLRTGVGEIFISIVNDQNLPAGDTVEVSSDFEVVRVPEFGSGIYICSGACLFPESNCWYYCPGQPYGDTNGDGKVNATDYFNFKKSYGTAYATHPHGTGVGQYNCCCDFNHDLRVNATDYFTFKKNYGKSGLGTCSDTSCP